MEKESISNGCYRKFDKCYKLTKHLKENADFDVLHGFGKTTMGKCNNCNTWREMRLA